MNKADLSDAFLRALYSDIKEALGKEEAEDFKEKVNRTFDQKDYKKVYWEE